MDYCPFIVNIVWFESLIGIVNETLIGIYYDCTLIWLGVASYFNSTAYFILINHIFFCLDIQRIGAGRGGMWSQSNSIRDS